MNIKLIKLSVAAFLVLFTGIVQATPPQMRVQGRVEVDGIPGADSIKSDIENGSPEFTRPAISVEDEKSGVWRYLASVDSTVPKLQVYGSVTNNTGGKLGNVEIGPLSVFASYTDTITLTPQITDPYLVKVEMEVNGLLDFETPGVGQVNSRAAASLVIAPQVKSQTNAFASYTLPGSINDVLSGQYQFSGPAVFDLETSLQFAILQLDNGDTATGDFSHTAIINLIVTDMGGRPLSPEDFEVTSQSGYFQTAPVPLPSALPLFSIALVGLIGIARLRVG